MNLYVHFPFCRRKCSYCALYSRVGVSPADRDTYVARIATHLQNLTQPPTPNNQLPTTNNQLPTTNTQPPTTIYFGGGSPALCNLSPLKSVLHQLTANNQLPTTNPQLPPTNNQLPTTNNQLPIEFTVELHPLDVTEEKLLELKDLGVNRISMGVQSLDDGILAHMGRGYTADFAARAFEHVRRHFDNAGIDLIVGYPDETLETFERVKDFDLRHCSVYALQNERHLENVPDDETTMNRLREVGSLLTTLGLDRYEISNYAVPGYECRHNLAVWRGEDYVGLGDGASGRLGLTRTRNFGSTHPVTETVTPEQDDIERTIFRLRTREGLDASRHPEWLPVLSRFVSEGLLRQQPPTAHHPPPIYTLTPRGAEVCDTILAELV